MPVNGEVHKILIIKLGGLGDVFLSTIVLAPLRKAYPEARIDYLVDKAGAEAVRTDPHISAITSIDKETMSPLEVIKLVRDNRYDMVLDLFGNPRSAIITLFSGAKHRIGLDYGWRRYCYSIVGTANREKLHGAEVNLQALKALGIPFDPPQLTFHLSEEDKRLAGELFDQNGLENKFVIGLLPAGSWQSKRCEPEKFAEIAKTLRDRYNAQILIVWGPSDEGDARKIQGLAGTGAILSPKQSLSRNMALLARCSAIVANDSGPMHISSAFGVPILVLYGPTFPEGAYGNIHGWVRNEGLSCLVCNLLQCPIQHQCMTELPVEKVMDAFQLLGEKNGILKQG
jgi:ADP-heptose:LPS heptosyltransferase